MKSSILRLPVEPKDTAQFFKWLCVFWMLVSLGILTIAFCKRGVQSMIEARSPRIAIVDSEKLFAEKAYALAQLKLTPLELKQELSDFKQSFKQALKRLPAHYVVFNGSTLMRTDNVLDVTPQVTLLLQENQS